MRGLRRNVKHALDASLLQRFGRKDVIHVVEGGVGTWARKGYEANRAT